MNLGAAILGNLVLSGANWLWFAALVTGLALALLFWSYRRGPGGAARWWCFVLKAVGLAALALCLLEPLWSGERARPGANLFAIVADNSQGLQIKDRGAARSRGEELRALLDPQQAAWLGELERNFEVRRYLVDGRLQTTRDFAELAFDGRASAIGGALRALGDRYRGRPLAGVLLLTDGNATDLREAPNLAGYPPVYPVVIGGPDAPRDISLQEPRVTQSDFEDAPVSIQAEVATADFADASVVAQLFDGAGKKVAEQTLRARKAQDTLPFRFQLRPEKNGLSFYRLRVRAAEELPASAPEKSSEATLANNSRVLVVNRGHGPYRILYVSGRPNWEFKFLNRALQADDQLELSALIRVAKREPKFTFLGRAGETSNPLFRGFGNQSPEEVERYDQPVLIRFNTRDELELRGGFPRAPEELYAYHAVIVDDLEAQFFTPDQAALLQRFVSERGGGVLMLGGMECFRQGNYLHTPIGDMLPVYLDRAEEAAPPPVSVRLNLTHEGWLQPWARLRDNESEEKARLQQMAPFLVLNRVGEAKPGASVIATVADEAGKSYPALVVQRFGRGRTAALTIGDLWHWGLHDEDAHRDMDKAWRQFMRWLVTDVPNRVELAVETQAVEASGAVNLQVRARDAKFLPLDDARVTVEIRPVLAESGVEATNVLRLQAEPSATEPGLYEVAYVPHATGGYRASAYVTNSTAAEVGRAEAGWSTDLAAEEFRSLTPESGVARGDRAPNRRRGHPGPCARGVRPPIAQAPGARDGVVDLSAVAYAGDLRFRPALPAGRMGTPALERNGVSHLTGMNSNPRHRIEKSTLCWDWVFLACLLWLFGAVLVPAEGMGSARPKVLIVVGAAGAAEYGSNFVRQAELWQAACAKAKCDQTTLGLEVVRTNDFDQFKATLESEAKEGPAPLWLVLIGHGTHDGKDAPLQSSRPGRLRHRSGGLAEAVRAARGGHKYRFEQRSFSEPALGPESRDHHRHPQRPRTKLHSLRFAPG